MRGLIQINMLYVTNLPEADSCMTHRGTFRYLRSHRSDRSVFISAFESLLQCQMFFFLFLWSRHLAAQIVSHRARLPSKACVQPDVSVTYFIIGSNQHQSPIKHEAVADGGCVLRCLVCLSGSVKYLLIRKKGNPCFPAG